MSEPSILHSRSVRHALPLLHPAQAQKEFTVNEALARLDMVAQASVIATAAAPPAEPAAGDSYIVSAGATDAFEGREDTIAAWQGDQWLFQAPMQGMRAYRQDIGATVLYRDRWEEPLSAPPLEGGEVVDAEARTMIAALREVLLTAGVISAA